MMTPVQRDPGHLRRVEEGAGEAAGARGGQHPPGDYMTGHDMT